MSGGCLVETSKKHKQRKTSLSYTNAYGPGHFQPKRLRKQNAIENQVLQKNQGDLSEAENFVYKR